MRIYGYCRISRKKQSIARQEYNIKKVYPEAVIITEAYTGTTQARPKWMRLKDTLKSGDLVVFDEISRMSRNATEGFKEYMELYERGVNLEFLKDAALNTENYRTAQSVSMTGTEVDIILGAVNQYLQVLAGEQIKAAFKGAEREIELLHKRTSEGVKRAQAEGKQVGRAAGATLETRKAKKAKALMKKHCKMFGGTLTDNEVIKLAGVSRKTFYKYKKELQP